MRVIDSEGKPGMAANDKLKQSLYFPDEVLGEIMREANRLDRSLSWTVQQAWRIARTEVRKFPSAGWRAPAPAAAAPAPSFSRPEPTRAEPRAMERDLREPSTQVLEFLRGKFDNEVTG
jgi:uncharacterized small protein (TIGR04563 family)